MKTTARRLLRTFIFAGTLTLALTSGGLGLSPTAGEGSRFLPPCQFCAEHPEWPSCQYGCIPGSGAPR